MKIFDIKIRIYFKKKPLFHDKTEEFKVYVCVPSEWNKQYIEQFAFEAARGYIKKNFRSAFKKEIYQLSIIEFNEKTFLKNDSKIYKYDYWDRCGKWDQWDDYLEVKKDG